MLKPWAEASSWLLGPVFFFGSQLDPKELENPPGLAFFVGGWGGKRGHFCLGRDGDVPSAETSLRFEVLTTKNQRNVGPRVGKVTDSSFPFPHWNIFFPVVNFRWVLFFEAVVCQLLFLEDIANFPSQPRPYPLEKTPRTLRCPKFRTWTRGNVPSAPGHLVFVFREMDGTRQGWMFGSPRVSNQKHWMPGPFHTWLTVSWTFLEGFSWSRNQIYQDYEQFSVGQ